MSVRVPNPTLPFIHILRSSLRPLEVGLCVSLLACGSVASAQTQVPLSFSAGNTNVLLGGRAASIAAPQMVGDLLMLPLNDTVLLLGYHLTRQGDVVSVVGANLSVDLSSNLATVGTQRWEAGHVAVLGGKVYVSARVLAAGLGGQLVSSGGSSTLLAPPKVGFNLPAASIAPAPALNITRPVLPGATPGAVVSTAPITAPRPAPTAILPAPPQARFSTDKAVYAPGERIVFTDYSFDPEGGGIASRNWTGRKEAYWTPGSYPVSLQVTNGRGQTSTAFTRTIRVQGQAGETPVSYALRYGQIGDKFADSRVLNYPVLTLREAAPSAVPLLFSDSPEKPNQNGILYQDTVSGEARLLGYHVNDLDRPARLYIVARNLETRPVSVQVLGQGETAPSRVEGILGQVTLMDYFASTPRGSVNLPTGGMTALYVSPTLNPGHGASILQEVQSSGRVALSFVMLEEGQTLSDSLLRSLPYLPLDGRHQRGTFGGADRPMSAALGQLPARVVIGDGQHDPVITGRDSVTGSTQRLAGNYGVLYSMEFTGAAGTAIALSPRGGLYRGAMRITDGDLSQVIKLPREGNALTPNEPHLLWRVKSDRVRIEFMPSNGSALPINLVFYRLPANTYKWYQP